jgi:hypothetical protein
MSENKFEKILREGGAQDEEELIKSSETPYDDLLEKTDAELAQAIRSSLEDRARYAREAVTARRKAERDRQVSHLDESLIQGRNDFNNLTKIPEAAVDWPKDSLGRTKSELLIEVGDISQSFAEREMAMQLAKGESPNDVTKWTQNFYNRLGLVAKYCSGDKGVSIIDQPAHLSIKSVYEKAGDRLPPHEITDSEKILFLQATFVHNLASWASSAPEFLIEARKLSDKSVRPADALVPHLELIEQQRQSQATNADEYTRDKWLHGLDTTMEQYGYVWSEAESKYLATPEKR